MLHSPSPAVLGAWRSVALSPSDPRLHSPPLCAAGHHVPTGLHLLLVQPAVSHETLPLQHAPALLKPFGGHTPQAAGQTPGLGFGVLLGHQVPIGLHLSGLQPLVSQLTLPLQHAPGPLNPTGGHTPQAIGHTPVWGVGGAGHILAAARAAG